MGLGLRLVKTLPHERQVKARQDNHKTRQDNQSLDMVRVRVRVVGMTVRVRSRFRARIRLTLIRMPEVQAHRIQNVGHFGGFDTGSMRQRGPYSYQLPYRTETRQSIAWQSRHRKDQQLTTHVHTPQREREAKDRRDLRRKKKKKKKKDANLKTSKPQNLPFIVRVTQFLQRTERDARFGKHP